MAQLQRALHLEDRVQAHVPRIIALIADVERRASLQLHNCLLFPVVCTRSASFSTVVVLGSVMLRSCAGILAVLPPRALFQVPDGAERCTHGR